MTIEKTTATIKGISPLTDSILQIILSPEEYIDYQPGQYLKISLAGEDEPLCYSIANAPLGSHTYELHVRHSPDNQSVQHLLAHMKQKGNLKVQLPFGDCELSRLDMMKPILFIAGGTGFAPVKAMIEQLLVTNKAPPFELFWGARSQSDLYMDEQVTKWQAHVNQFRYFSMLSQSTRENLVAKILAHHEDDIKDWQMVISGPFEMVYRVRDLLLLQGVSQNALFSDAFAFESDN